MKELTDFIAAKLLKMKAIKIQPNNPFEWGNGWISPIYFDSRKILSYPHVRCQIKVELARVLIETYPDVECIAAVAPNAIAIGYSVAEDLGLPFVYVHGRPKDHGLENCIEGDLRPRQKVVIIEDQVSEGKYCTKVQDALQKDGSIVMGMISIFDYELTVGQQHLKKNALQNRSLTCFNSIINYAIQSGVLSPENEEIMRMWQRAPQEWRKKK
ncbi:MAG: orotate phosphoribosyltransferase [Paludibacteraceae bacterium]